MSRPLEEQATFAVDLAQRAGRLTLDYFQRGVEASVKADGSPVTVADRAAEELLRRDIRKRFPEEQGVEDGVSGWTWIVDPIDGTASFVRGVPLFGVMIGLEFGGKTQLGVIHLPALGETVWAWRGGGCWRNGRPSRVSTTQDLSASLLCLTEVPADDGEYLGNVIEATGLRRTWGDCYGYVLVATGRAEVMIDRVCSIWDVAAVQPILEEAGGCFSDLTGQSTIRGGHALGTNGHVHEQVLELLR